MKKKIIVTILVLGILFFGVSKVFGAFEYERTPSEYSIFNPVTFDVSFITSDCPATTTIWRIGGADDTYETIFSSEWVDIATTTGIFEINVPLATYYYIGLGCWADEENRQTLNPLEFDEGNPLFEVLSSEPTPFIETDEIFVAGVIGYVRGWLGSGIFPLLAMFIGIPLAFVVIKRVIALLPQDKK